MSRAMSTGVHLVGILCGSMAIAGTAVLRPWLAIGCVAGSLLVAGLLIGWNAHARRRERKRKDAAEVLREIQRSKYGER